MADTDQRLAGASTREAAATQKEEANTKRAAELDAYEAALNTRDAEVTKKEEVKKATTLSDGIFLVGGEVAPGTYRRDADGDLCYASAESKSGQVMEQEVDHGRVIITIAPSAYKFTSNRCGAWSKIG